MVTRTFTLGRYTCVERLGIGPVGELWRAKRFGLIGVERQFSLSRLHPPLAKGAAAVARLQAALKIYAELEVELLSTESAPADGAGDGAFARLLRLHEQAAAPGGADVYIVCDFPGFADLRKLRAGFEIVAPAERAGELWAAVVTYIGRTLSTLLAKAQARGLWHGLLCPGAITIGEGGRVFLAELGFAQALPPTNSSLVSDANWKPLLPYLPKEVLAGTPLGLDSDIYALGFILDELSSHDKSATGELRAIVQRARAEKRADRPATMRELATALAGLPLSTAQIAAAQKTLARIAEQFQLSGDSVPQPVNISERSSAEPLPPPPGARSIDISKANIGGMSGRVRPSAPGAKPLERGKAAMRDISDISQPPRHLAAPPPPETATIARHESEDTPLPASRPLLMTNPQIQTISGEDPKRKVPTGPQPKSVPILEKVKTGPNEVKAARNPSRDDIRVQRARSGIDWLTSNSDQLAIDDAASKQPTAPQTSPSKPNKTSLPPQPTAAETSGEKSSSGPNRTPTPAGGVRRRSNPVTINPRARGAVRTGTGSASATTPTAEVDIGEASAADNEALNPSAATLDERPKSASTLRGAAAAMALSNAASNAANNAFDSLSAGETNPQLAPVKVFPKKAALGEEPTNPVSLEDVARAASITESSPDRQKRRSGPISEPNPRVLSSTAPAEIVAVHGVGAPSPSPDVLGSTGLRPLPTGPGGEVLTQDFAVDGMPSTEPRKPRTGLLIGGALALMLAVGLVYLLVAASNQNNRVALVDAGPGTAADAGAAAVRDKVAADSLVLSTTPPATVFIDGSDKGKTPLTLKLAPGPHKLLLIAELYALTRREVTGGAKLDLKLEAAKLPADVLGEAGLKIKCKSDGKLRILVDGHDSGHSCPSDALSLSLGKHVLAFLDPATDDTKEKKIKAKKGKKPAKIKIKY